MRSKYEVYSKYVSTLKNDLEKYNFETIDYLGTGRYFITIDATDFTELKTELEKKHYSIARGNGTPYSITNKFVSIISL